MKFDITKMPIAEATIGFLVLATILAFIGAYGATGGSGQGEAVSASPTPRETGSPDGSPSPVGPPTITMEDNSFDPEEIAVEAGSSVTFQITNEGSAIHNVHIAGPDGEYTEDFCTGRGDPCSDPSRINGGAEATLTWEVPPSLGEVDFRCDFHPQQMTGTITIE